MWLFLLLLQWYQELVTAFCDKKGGRANSATGSGKITTSAASVDGAVASAPPKPSLASRVKFYLVVAAVLQGLMLGVWLYFRVTSYFAPARAPSEELESAEVGAASSDIDPGASGTGIGFSESESASGVFHDET